MAFSLSCCAPTPSIVLTFAVDVNDARSTRCARSHLYNTARLLGVSTWNSMVCQDRLGTNAIEQPNEDAIAPRVAVSIRPRVRNIFLPPACVHPGDVLYTLDRRAA